METEIWPNFLRECRRADVPVIFVNGRLSERSFRGYGRALSYSAGALAGFLKKVLGDATLFLMQSEEDAARLIALGAPRERVLVTGNLKYDLAEPGESPLSAWLEAELAKSDRRPVVVAGSVLANEEASVLRAFAEVEREFPRALLILAPRKPEQFDNAAAIVAGSGRKLLRRRDLDLNGAGKRRAFRASAMYFCSTVSASLPDCIALPTPCSWEARSFPAAGTIFWSRLRSAKFRSTARRWKISAKCRGNFLRRAPRSR